MKSHKTIRISMQIWDAMEKHGHFGATADTILREVFAIAGIEVAPREKKERHGFTSEVER